MRQAFRLIAATLLFATASVQAQLPQKVGDTPVPSLAPIINKTSPAVVNIATRKPEGFETQAKVITKRLHQVPSREFFTELQYKTLEAVCDRVIPQPERSAPEKVPIVTPPNVTLLPLMPI